MPIYEFYCIDCHTVYNFFARTCNTTKRPSCPRCGRPKLERRMSTFAISSGRGGGSTKEDEGPDFEEPWMERAVAELGHEHDCMDEDDPGHVVQVINRLHEIAGKPLGGKARELVRRIEAGESPEKIDEALGDQPWWEDEDSPLAEGGPLRGLGRKLRPAVDGTLYDL
jgi:putative FmdB family regulatory protein